MFAIPGATMVGALDGLLDPRTAFATMKREKTIWTVQHYLASQTEAVNQ